MPAADPDAMLARVRERLAARLASERRSALVFALLTLLLTPLFVAVASVLFALFMSYTGVGGPVAWGSGRVGSSSVLACLFGMGFAVVWKHDPRRGPRNRAPVALAGALWLAMVVLVAAPGPHGGWSAAVFGALAFTVLAALLRVYEPEESYYLGWLAGGAGDPFTLSDDIDREHLAFGFVGSVVGIVVDAYGEILRSAWLARSLRGDDLAAAAALCVRLAEGPDSLAAYTLADRSQAARALRLLERLDAVRFGRSGPRLTGAGRELVKVVGGP